MAARVRLLFHNRSSLYGVFRSLQQNIGSRVATTVRQPTAFMMGGFLSTSASDDVWRSKLTPEQYHVCREKGTERPWSGEYLRNKEAGVYQCVCCGVDLFSSTTKFDSGSGWPSFYAAIGENEPEINNVAQKRDVSFGMVRVEVLCKQCGSHLGHVFNEGPEPTGLRYCINSLSLDFTPSK